MRSNIGKDTLILTFVRIITVFSSLLILMFLSRTTTLEEYGTYSQIILVITLTTSLFMLGLPNSINYFLSKAENKNEQKNFLLTYYSITVLLSLLMGLTLVFISDYLEAYFQNESISHYLLVLLILPWAKITNTSIENVLVVMEQVQKLQIYKLMHSLSLIFVAFFSYIYNFNLTEFFVLYLIVEIIYALIVYIFIFKITNILKFTIDYFLMKKIFKFSIPIGLASLVGTLNIQMDKLIVGRYFDTETLAVYFNASKEIPINVLAVSLTAVIMPRLVRLFNSNNTDKAINLWGHSILISYYFIAFFVMIFFIFATDILTALYSSKYESGATVFKIYSLVLLLRVTYFGIILNSTGKTKIVLYSSLIAIIINLIFNVILIRIIGIEGPAIATLLSMICMALFQLYMSSRLLKVSLLKLLPWKKLMIVSGVVSFLGFLGFILKINLPLEMIIGSILESLGISLLLLIIYFIIFKKSFIKTWEKMNSIGSGI